MHGTPLNRKVLFSLTAATLLSGALLLPLQTRAATIYISGTISTSTTLTSANVYIIEGATISSGTVITVQSGTVVKFIPGANLDIAAGGNLVINGTSTSKVYLTSLNDNSVGGTIASSTGNPAPGDWLAIENEGSSTITDAVIRYGGAEFGSFHFSGDVLVDGGTMSISGSQISSSSNEGVFILGGTTEITSSTISNNTIDGVGMLQGESVLITASATITSSTISNNVGFAIDEQDASGTLQVTGSTLSGNGTSTAGGEGGAGFIDMSGGINFIHSGNTASGIDSGFEITGTTVTSTVWNKDLTYIPANLVIASQTTLTVNHGVVIKPLGLELTTIEGSLNVQGTSTDPVYVTSLNDNSVGSTTSGSSTSTPALGDWATILSEGTSTITNAIMRYGGGTVGGYSSGGNVIMDGGSVTISNSQLASSSHEGIYFVAGSATITSSTMSNNDEDGIGVDAGLGSTVTASATITNSVLSNNGQDGVYEFNATGTAISITSSTISNNGAQGIYESNSSGNFLLTSSTFYANNASGSSFGDGYFDLDSVAFTPSGNIDTTTSTGVGYRGFFIVGSPSTSSTWSNGGLPYVIDGPLTIPSSTTLTINSGTVIKFLNDSALLENQGTLNVSGTSTNPVYFTSFNDNSIYPGTNGTTTSDPLPGDWATIQTDSGSATTLTNAVIRYGGGGSSMYNFANLNVLGGNLTVLNSELSSSSDYAIYNDGGSTAIESSEIFNNLYGVSVATGTLGVVNSSIYDNSSDGVSNSTNVTSSAYAENNYWGAASGPYNASGNASGTGNPVSNYVDFSHWLTSWSSSTNPTPYATNLTQYGVDGITPIPDNTTTTQSTVVFSATLQSSGTSALQLQVEVTTSTAFKNVATVTSAFVSSGSTTTATAPGTPESSSDGNYHWQYRVVASSTGNASLWQSFSPNPVDFTMRTVPEYTQQTSTFPSLASTTSWYNQSYDNSSSTIAAEGCAITSAVMDLRYLGITTDVSGTDVNPGTINSWLEANGGYDVDEDLKWNDVPFYAETAGGQLTISTSVVIATGTWNTLSSTVNSYLSETTTNPVILYEPNAPNGAATTTHFVVATGFATSKGTSTYTIRDSLWYNTKYLNQATGTAWVNNYNNTYNDIFVLLPEPGYGGLASSFGGSNSVNDHAPLSDLFNVYSIANPDGLLLTDSSGRRTGEDPKTGVIYQEIPNTTYIPQPHGIQLTFTSPPAGQYTIQIIGNHVGQYRFGMSVNNGIRFAQAPAYTGSIQPGQVITYSQNYDPSNLISSQNVATSTN